jgi:hypothetical protein
MAKKQTKQYGMGPGQSMAMAGNTGLASFTEKDINKVQQEKRAYNDFSGRDRNQNASFTDIGQEIGELGSKYRRPVKIADGFGAYSDGSGRAYTPNDFNADGSFRSFTATQPTASQVFGRDGDVRRAFKGYNTLKYDDPGRGYSPVSMQRTPGMIEQGILSPLTTMAKAALSATNDLAGKVKPLYSGTVDLFKEGVGALNDVQQQIFMNPKKYKFARNQEEIIKAEEKEDEVNRLETLNEKIEADRKQFEDLLNISVQQDNLETPEIFRDQFTGTGQSYMDTKENFNSRIPPGTANIPGGTPTGTANAPGGRGNFLDSDAYREMLLNNYQEREMGTGNMPGGVDPMGLPVQGDITIDVNKDTPYFGRGMTGTPVGEFDSERNINDLRNNQSGIKTLSEGNSITDYLNPGNLVDVGQDGTTGKTYGENKYAIFDSVDSGLRALTKDLNKKVGDFDGDVEKIISKYASGDPDVKGYVDFITDIVGPTVEENEIPTLIESIIIKENKPEIADQYLKYLKENSDKIYDGIISSKNNTSKNNTMLAEITQADIDRFKQPMTQMMEYETYKDINTDSTLTRDEFNQLKARVA